MKTLMLILVLLISSSVLASNVICEGWYQESGSNLVKTELDLISSNENNILYSGSYNGYFYSVDWDKGLTTFYIRIEKEGSYILGTTARVPTSDHPENFTDLHIPNGPRLSINCEIK